MVNLFKPCECCQGEHCLPNYMCRHDSPVAVKPCECESKPKSINCIKEYVVLEGSIIGGDVKKEADSEEKCLDICIRELSELDCVASEWSIESGECTFFSSVERATMSVEYHSGFVDCEKRPEIEAITVGGDNKGNMGWIKDGIAISGPILKLDEKKSEESVQDCLKICFDELSDKGCKAAMWGRKDKMCYFFTGVTELVKSSKYDSAFVDDALFSNLEVKEDPNLKSTTPKSNPAGNNEGLRDFQQNKKGAERVHFHFYVLTFIHRMASFGG